MNRAPRLLPLTALITASTSACGGSGSNSSAPASTSGMVADSYSEHAEVCIDTNNNGKCDSGEASTYTGANGVHSLSSTSAITAEIGTDAFRSDPDEGTYAAITQPLVFCIPADTSAAINAISIELAVLMDSNDGDINTAETTLAVRLGMTIDRLLEDHNKETDADTKVALRAETNQAIDLIADAIANGGDIDKRLHDGVTKRMALANNVEAIVVIYAGNRDFDNLYDLFPGINSISSMNPTSVGTAVAQKDFGGSVLPALPSTWGGMTVASQSMQITQVSTANTSNQMSQIDSPSGFDSTGTVVDQNVITRDLWHRSYQDQMQINGGKSDKFAALADAGDLTMGYCDGSKIATRDIIKQCTLADNFFMGAFGGSFLNH